MNCCIVCCLLCLKVYSYWRLRYIIIPQGKLADLLYVQFTATKRIQRTTKHYGTKLWNTTCNTLQVDWAISTFKTKTENFPLVMIYVSVYCFYFLSCFLSFNSYLVTNRTQTIRPSQIHIMNGTSLRRQTIGWTNGGLLLANYNEMFIKIKQYYLKKNYFTMSSAN